jgi:hypothetical protein
MCITNFYTIHQNSLEISKDSLFPEFLINFRRILQEGRVAPQNSCNVAHQEKKSKAAKKKKPIKQNE